MTNLIRINHPKAIRRLFAVLKRLLGLVLLVLEIAKKLRELLCVHDLRRA